MNMSHLLQEFCRSKKPLLTITYKKLISNKSLTPESSQKKWPSRNLGDNATSKDFFNLFIKDEFLDEIVRHRIAYARSKGDATFVTNRAEISAYLGLNILIGIQELPQLAMYWDSDQFIGVKPHSQTSTLLFSQWNINAEICYAFNNIHAKISVC